MATNANQPPSAREDVKLALYEQGLTDREIAARAGLRPNTIVVWRRERGLPVNSSGRGPGAPQCEARKLLYDLGWSDGRIAREQSVDKASVRDWRRRHHLPANFTKHGSRPKRRQINLETVRERIVAAVGQRLPADIADDAVSDLTIAVLEQKVSIDQIEKEAKRFGNKVLEQFANKFGPRSLDEELGSEEGFRMVDMIVDEESRDWLDEMGATVS